MRNNIAVREGFQITLNTTEACNLACTYCYELNKQPRNLDVNSAEAFIDMILQNQDILGIKGTEKEYLYDSLIISFIGGDSFANVDIMRKTLRYFQWKAVLMNHPWAYKWFVNISTNGTYFKQKEVREFLEEFIGVIGVSVSIDGCPELHDLNRVYLDGSGSMKDILESWDWYKDYCKRAGIYLVTKSTLNKASIPYIYKSLVYMHEELGLNIIHQNFIMENMNLTDKDYDELNRQMELCLTYMLKHKDLYWSLISPDKIGSPFNEENKKQFRCGAGLMPSLYIDGSIYPCNRFFPSSLGNPQDAEKYKMGSIQTGILNTNLASEIAIEGNWGYSDEECRNCNVQSACSFCVGGSVSELGVIKRLKHICKITKIMSYWAKRLEDESNY